LVDQHIAKLREFIEKMKVKGVSIIYTRHIFDPKNNPIETKLFPELADGGLRDGTKGAEICKELNPKEKDIIISKRRYDAFMGTELEIILRSKGIENLIITGTMTNICCESTARTAMMKDFNVFFCSDLTFTTDLEIHNNTLKNISTHFGKVVRSEDIVRFF